MIAQNHDRVLCQTLAFVTRRAYPCAAMRMSRSATPTRQPVNLSLDPVLVRRAKTLTRNLSGTVEALLADFVAREEAARRAEDARSSRVVAALNGLHAEHGSLADDFSPL